MSTAKVVSLILIALVMGAIIGRTLQQRTNQLINCEPLSNNPHTIQWYECSRNPEYVH